MADFNGAFNKMMQNEGGYVLHNVKGDRGGETYAGIARNFWPKWEGWKYIDNDKEGIAMKLVYGFYYKNFWERMGCAEIASGDKAESIFDFSVNTGIRVASRVVQMTVGAKIDGIIGSKTVELINNMDDELFISHFVIAKIARYTQICNKNKSQRKFLLGWINRSLKGV